MAEAMAQARKFAEWALLARLTSGVGFGDSKRNDTIKGTVARIRAGNGDHLAVVQSAFLALTSPDRSATATKPEGVRPEGREPESAPKDRA